MSNILILLFGTSNVGSAAHYVFSFTFTVTECFMYVFKFCFKVPILSIFLSSIIAYAKTSSSSL